MQRTAVLESHRGSRAEETKGRPHGIIAVTGSVLAPWKIPALDNT